MTPLDRLATGIDTVDELLAERILDPNPERRDWPQAEPRVQLLEVADVYRELGLETRTREILEKVYAASGDLALKQRVAFQRAHAQRDIDDQDFWLKRSDPNDGTVRALLLENAAQRDLGAGRDLQADQGFRAAAAIYERDARHSSAAANNAALALLGRYAATGDPQHRREALARLESALRLAPDSAIVHGNLADALEDTAVMEALAGWVDLPTLRPSGNDSVGLFSTLVRGAHREALLGALRAHPAFLRARSVNEQEQVLAPRKPAASQRLVRWLGWMGDAAGLQALAERLEQTPPDLGSLAAEREEWRSGRRDALWRTRLTEARALVQARVARARSKGHAPTLAAALLLLAEAEQDLARVEGGPAGLDRAVTACREAVRLWPGVGLESDLADALMLAAAEHAAESSSEWRARWTAGQRSSTVSWLLLEASRDPRGGPAVAAVRARPELAEALALRASVAASRPEIGHLVLARALGDTAAASAASAVAARPEVGPELRLAALFEPDGAEERGRLELFESLRGPGGPAVATAH